MARPLPPLLQLTICERGRGTIAERAPRKQFEQIAFRGAQLSRGEREPGQPGEVTGPWPKILI